MKILYLADGGTVHTYRFIKYFAEQGHEIELISMRPVLEQMKVLPIKIVEKKYHPKNFFLRLITYSLRIPELILRIRKSKADIVHAHEAASYGIFAYFSGGKYVLSPWGSDILIIPNKNKIFKYFIKKTLQHAQKIIYDGGPHMAKALKSFGVKKNKLKTFNFGVDINIFNSKKKSNTLRKQITKNNPDATIIISTRNLAPVYDIKTYIDAALKIPSEYETVFLVGGDGTERERLVKYVKENKAEKKIIFIGKKKIEELAEYVSTADIYVSTAVSDAGIAASTAEAMGCGLPAIITDFGDNGNWIQNNVNGFLFESRNSTDLAEKIIFFLQHKTKIREFGEKNINIIHEKNNYYKEMKIVETEYKELLK